MKKTLLIALTIIASFNLNAQTYFPPISQSAFWDTTAMEDLGWCRDKVDSLFSYLEDENSKGFIVLKDGKIVIEKYFDSFTKDSLWYWASAGKTITALLVGAAQEDGFLEIDSPSSKYLGQNWTSCSPTQEQAITVWHQLTMTTGLDDGVADNHCTIDTCLQYLADPGDRWSYHNAPYTLLEKVISNASAQNINTYTNNSLKSKVGMNGFWLTLDYDNVYFSNVRSMARFGLLIQNDCVWDGDSILKDQSYIHQMVNTSQSLNESYGYLWWLNGKSSFMVPGLQNVFPGSYAPNAPSDMYAGIGKNGQIVSISDSEDLVVIRMGNAPSGLGAVPIALIDGIWEKLNAVRCGSVGIADEKPSNYSIYPNPSDGRVQLMGNFTAGTKLQLINSKGQVILDQSISSNTNSITLNVQSIEHYNHLYFLRIVTNNTTVVKRLIIH